MKVRRLMEVLSKQDPDMEVVLSSSDHHYNRVVLAMEITVERWKENGHLSDYDPDGTVDPGVELVKVLVLR